MYAEARRKAAKGWSTMSKAQLESAVGRWSSEEADDPSRFDYRHLHPRRAGAATPYRSLS